MSEDFILRYGGASNKSVSQARQNFAQAGFDNLSLCCTPVEILTASGEQKRITHASGFFGNVRAFHILLPTGMSYPDEIHSLKALRFQERDHTSSGSLFWACAHFQRRRLEFRGARREFGMAGRYG